MIRVLQWRIGPAGDGVTRAVLSSSGRMAPHTVHFGFITGERETGLCQELIRDALPDGEHCRVYSLPLSPLRHPLRYRREVKALLDEDFDLLHYNASYFISTILLRQAKKRGIPIILHAHSAAVDVVNPIKRWVYRQLHRFNRRRAVRSADLLLTSSDRAAQWMFGSDARRALCHPVGIDCAAYAFRQKERESLRQEWGIREDQPLIGHVGRFAYPKNHEFVLEVFDTLRRTQPDAVLVLAGTGEREPEIRTLAQSRGLAGSVRFLGLRDDVPRLMQAMDALLMPSRFEGLGLALIEAQAAGLPCLASDAVPQEAAVTGRIRRLSLAESPDQWAAVLRKLLTRYGPSTREAANRQVAQAGWDAAEQAGKLQAQYFVLCGRQAKKKEE